MISLGFIYFVMFAPAVVLVLGFIIKIVCWLSDSSDKTGAYNYGSSYSFDEPDYNEIESSRILSSMEKEMRSHNARMEQMMMDQHRTMIENESRRISENINRPLSDQLDTRLTNIFRNPWDGIL